MEPTKKNSKVDMKMGKRKGDNKKKSKIGKQEVIEKE